MKKCPVCGKDHNTKNKHCSRECFRESMRGPNNSQYQNGVGKCRRWRVLKEERRRYGMFKREAIERLGGQCEICGIDKVACIKKHNQLLHVHHKDNQGRNVKKPNNKINNLQLLCPSCHGKIHMTTKRAKYMRSLQPRDTINWQ